MEDLGTILKRIVRKTTNKNDSNKWPTNEDTPSEESSPECPRCKDDGWLALPLDLNHRVNGQVIQETITCPCRNTTEAGVQRRLKYANLPDRGEPRTFDNFMVCPGTEESISAAELFASAGDGGIFPWLTFWGPNGNGKSHLLEAIGREMLDQGHTVKYLFVPKWLIQLRGTFDSDGEDSLAKVFEGLDHADVVLLDDLGKEKPSDWTREQIISLLGARYQGKRLTVITTIDSEDASADKQGWAITDRVYDIGSGQVQVVHNTAKSYRTGR